MRGSMLKLLRKKEYPIGIDLGGGSLKMVQLGAGAEGLELLSAAKVYVPSELLGDALALQEWYMPMILKLGSCYGSGPLTPAGLKLPMNIGLSKILLLPTESSTYPLVSTLTLSLCTERGDYTASTSKLERVYGI